MGTNALDDTVNIRICSDLHTEFWVRNQCKKKTLRILNRVLPHDERDATSTLIIAGDLGSLHNIKQQEVILQELSNRFQDIVICGGNHEYYGGDFVLGQLEYTRLYSKFGNVHSDYLNIINGVSFFTSTLWTDYNGENPFSMLQAQQGMNDYKNITNGSRQLTPKDLLLEHKRNKESLKRFLQETVGKRVVVTHHAPSYLSVPSVYQTSKLNPCYFSHLDPLIEEYQPELWVHGHTHRAVEYAIGKTKVICNPYGYRTYEKTGYEPVKFINL